MLGFAADCAVSVVASVCSVAVLAVVVVVVVLTDGATTSSSPGTDLSYWEGLNLAFQLK